MSNSEKIIHFVPELGRKLPTTDLSTGSVGALKAQGLPD
jgi:hypothetical protein